MMHEGCTLLAVRGRCMSGMGAFVQIVIAAESVNTTPDGVAAVVRLGGGDMRKTLNILQVREREREREGEDPVGSHARWKRPCLQTAHMTI
jgi:hypothetical protein